MAPRSECCHRTPSGKKIQQEGGRARPACVWGTTALCFLGGINGCYYVKANVGEKLVVLEHDQQILLLLDGGAGRVVWGGGRCQDRRLWEGQSCQSHLRLLLSFKKKTGNSHEVVTMWCAEPQGTGTPEPQTEHTRCPSPTGPSAGGGSDTSWLAGPGLLAAVCC